MHMANVFYKMLGANPNTKVWLIAWENIEHPKKYTLTALAKLAGISRTTLYYQVIPGLVQYDLIKPAGRNGKEKFYAFNYKNNMLNALMDTFGIICAESHTLEINK